MLKLLKVPTGKAYVDLIVSFEGTDEEDIPGPPVRYFTGSWQLYTCNLLLINWRIIIYAQEAIKMTVKLFVSEL